MFRKNGVPYNSKLEYLIIHRIDNERKKDDKKRKE